jgi:oligoendopeptidase F
MVALSLGFAAMAVAQEKPKEGEAKQVPDRSTIEKKYLWATENIYPDKAAWEKEYAEVEKAMGGLEKAKGTLGKGATELLAALTLKDEVEPRLEKVYVYASLISDQDTKASEGQAMKSRARTLAINYGTMLSWFEPELTTIPLDKIQGWMKENEKLALYRQYFDNVFRQAKYILPEREEELLAMAGQVISTPNNAYTMLANADIDFPTIKDDEGKTVKLDDMAYYKYMRNPDRKVRQAAYEGIVGTYAKSRNTAAALLNGCVQSHVFNMKARKYESCLAAALDGSNVPVGVYNNLIKTVNDNLSLLHRYQSIRKKAMKLDDGVRAWDLYAPLVTGPDATYEVKYEDAIKQIEEALQPLGPDYLAQMKKGFDSRWVDVFPTKNKKSGAYSSGTFLTQPYILMNYHGGFEDMSTLAHEMGHSMHSFLSHKTQPYIYGDYDIFCAEVASTCNEILLQNYILKKTTDPKVKLYLLVEFLEQIRGTVFRQTMFSEFEQRIHDMAEKGEPLTADAMSKEYRKIMVKYYGPDYVQDDLVDNYWIRIPHFYYNFYVYKYATSYCAASKIAKRIQAGEPGAVEAYLNFLKSGRSKYPIDLLKGAGVDMTTAEPMDAAMAIFKDMLDQTEVLANKQG